MIVFTASELEKTLEENERNVVPLKHLRKDYGIGINMPDLDKSLDLYKIDVVYGNKQLSYYVAHGMIGTTGDMIFIKQALRVFDTNGSRKYHFVNDEYELRSIAATYLDNLINAFEETDELQEA